MPAKFFIIDKKAKKDSRRFPIHIHRKIDIAFGKIQKNPLSGEKLGGELQNYYKFRVGDYRIVYSFNTKKSLVTVVKIEHRQGVYR